MMILLWISVLLDVAVHTWLCSSQSTIVVEVEPIHNSRIIAPYCVKFLLAFGSVPWGRKHSKLRPCMTLCLFSNRLCMFELWCCAWWCFGEAEARNQGLSRTQEPQMSVALHGFGPEELFPTRFVGISCLTGKHVVCLFAECTLTSPARSIVSQIKA